MFTEKFSKKIYPISFRSTLQNQCLMYSDNMIEKCIMCATNRTKQQYTWIKCIVCQRQIHNTCAGEPYKLITKDLENLNFICVLCDNYK